MKLKALAGQRKKKIAKYNTLEMKLSSHSCLKNFDRSSKAMESESIVQFILDCLKTRKSYVRIIIMDDDKTTPAHLKEDAGVTGIKVFAHSSNRRRMWSNGLYKLAKKRKKFTNINKARAKKWMWILDIGFFNPRGLP